MPRATRSRIKKLRDGIVCPACAHRFGDPVPRDGDDSFQIEDGVVLMVLMARALERFDISLQTGEMPPGAQGRPVPRALLPEGFEPPEGMMISESRPIAMDALPGDGELSEDEILDALQREVSGQQAGGVSDGSSNS